MFFDFTYQGITFEMEFIDLVDTTTTHWTDIVFASDSGDVVLDGKRIAWIDLEQLQPDTQKEIRFQSYDKYLKLCQDPQDDDIDRACFEYHQMKEES